MNPVGWLSAMGCWLVVCFWAVRLVHALISGDISFLRLFVTLYVLGGLATLALRNSNSGIAALIFLSMVIGTMLSPLAAAGIQTRQLRNITAEELNRIYEALAQRPQDPLLRLRLADAVAKLGNPHGAQAIASAALENLPVDSFRREHQLLRMYTIQASQVPVPAPTVCAKCRTPHDPRQPYCAKCGAPTYQRSSQSKARQPFRIPYPTAWLAAAMMLVAIPLTPLMAPPVGMIALAATLIFGIGVIIWTVRGGEA